MPSPSVWHIHGRSIHFDFFLWIQELLRNHLLTTPGKGAQRRGWGIITFTAELSALRRSLGKEVMFTMPAQIPWQSAPSKSSPWDHCHPLPPGAKNPLARWLSTEGWSTGLQVSDTRGLHGARETACLGGHLSFCCCFGIVPPWLILFHIIQRPCLNSLCVFLRNDRAKGRHVNE